MLARLTAIALTLLTPATAFACMNKMVNRPYDTYPLDFLHIGVGFAAAMGLYWSFSKKMSPTFTRKIAYAFAATIAGAGIGLFSAKVPALELTGFVGYAALNFAFVVVAFLTSADKPTDSTGVKLAQRTLLLLALLGSVAGAAEAFDGHDTVITSGFEAADPDLASQVVF